MGATEVAPRTSFLSLRGVKDSLRQAALALDPATRLFARAFSKIVPGKHPPPFSVGFRPPFTPGASNVQSDAAEEEIRIHERGTIDRGGSRLESQSGTQYLQPFRAGQLPSR